MLLKVCKKEDRQHGDRVQDCTPTKGTNLKQHLQSNLKGSIHAKYFQVLSFIPLSNHFGLKVKTQIPSMNSLVQMNLSRLGER